MVHTRPSDAQRAAGDSVRRAPDAHWNCGVWVGMQSSEYRVLGIENTVLSLETLLIGRVELEVLEPSRRVEIQKFGPEEELGTGQTGQGGRIPMRFSPVLPEHPLPLETPLQPE